MKVESLPDVVDLAQQERVLTVAEEVRIDKSARPRRTRRAIAYALMAFALVIAMFVLYLFSLSGLVEARAQRTLLERFRELSVGGPASTLAWRPAMGDPVAVLSIPRLGVQAVVVEGTSSSMTMGGPGHYRGSPLPGRAGNSVIAGRRATFGAPFSALDQLREGDSIRVATGVGLFVYRVTGLSQVRPDQTDVLGPTEDNRLTLITSAPRYGASGRLVATASLVGAPAKASLVAAPVIPADETGLSGQPWALAPLLLWTEVLLMALIGGVWLARRTAPRVGWLLGAPIAVAMIWAMYIAIARLLPATI